MYENDLESSEINRTDSRLWIILLVTISVQVLATFTSLSLAAIAPDVADGLKISLHQRICGSNNSCAIKEVRSSLNNEIKDKILRKAVLLKKLADEKDPNKNYKNEDGDINWCGDGRTIC